jgi:hypothetical protein
MHPEVIKTSEGDTARLESIPTQLPILPLRVVVVFYMIFPCWSEGKFTAAVPRHWNAANIFLAAQKATVEGPGDRTVWKGLWQVIQPQLPNGCGKFLDGVSAGYHRQMSSMTSFSKSIFTFRTGLDLGWMPPQAYICTVHRVCAHLSNIPSEVLLACENPPNPTARLSI